MGNSIIGADVAIATELIANWDLFVNGIVLIRNC